MASRYRTIMTSESHVKKVEQFNHAHGLHRSLYSILVNELCRDPVESIWIMALWVWLCRAGYNNVVLKILFQPHPMKNDLANEALRCINCINNARFLLSAEPTELPLTQSLMRKKISLEFFHENRLNARNGTSEALKEVCQRELSDLMDNAMKRNAASPQMQGEMKILPTVDHPVVPSCGQVGYVGETSHAQNRGNEIPQESRTMFMTFSKGFPVAEWEVKYFFSRIFGDCIESFHMQEVENDEQALHAHIVFHDPSVIDLILDGMEKAMFAINGKHIWMRKFEPRRANSSLPPPLPNLPEADL